MARPSRRRELLDAAIAVIRRDGAQALTLDAVAAAAGVSKGGVLYHFGTKRALIDGLLDSWLDDREAQLEGPDFAAAYVRACDMQSAGPEVTTSEFGLLAALIEDPEVLEVARVRLAADGLWYSDLLGIAAPQGEDRRLLIERLLALAAGEAR